MSLPCLKFSNDSPPCARWGIKSTVWHGSKLSSLPTSLAWPLTFWSICGLPALWELPIAPCPSRAVSYLCVFADFVLSAWNSLPKNLFPSLHPYQFASILLHSTPAISPLGSQPQLGRMPLFTCMSLSLHHRPVKECFIFWKSLSLIRPVAPKSGWTRKSLGLQLQKLWLNWFGRGPGILLWKAPRKFCVHPGLRTTALDHGLPEDRSCYSYLCHHTEHKSWWGAHGRSSYNISNAYNKWICWPCVQNPFLPWSVPLKSRSADQLHQNHLENFKEITILSPILRDSDG